MTFTPQTPTEPGFFLWKSRLESPPETAILVDYVPGDRSAPAGGLWCRLVPADECVPKEEVEKAWMEAANTFKTCDSMILQIQWENSRAKRIAEGLEDTDEDRKRDAKHDPNEDNDE